jgi:repressor LexA
MVNRIKSEPTVRQKAVLEAVRSYLLEHGEAPTVRRLGEMLDIAHPSAVFKHIRSLERKGWLRRGRDGIRLAGGAETASRRVRVPLVGLVTAGHPREAFDVTGEALDIPDWMLGRKGNVFCVEVEGKSMVDAYIDDGDRVLVERTATANSGEMVVAALDDGSITLKRLRLEQGRTWLMPENPEFQPIEVPQVRILGRVIGVLRKY